MQLIITEKPSVARTIGSALGVFNENKGYLEGRGYLISWCIGHLVELAQPEMYDPTLKSWTYESLPIIPDSFKYEIKKNTKDQFYILKKLMEREDVDTIISAVDAGREGELIFRLVYEKAGCKKKVERLWLSSLEESAIKEGFSNLKPSSYYDNLYRSALARQKADWLVGINGTRLFTTLYQGKVLKVGRVQSPTLSMIVERDEAIRAFKKEPFYSVKLSSSGISFVSQKFKTKDEADYVEVGARGTALTIAKVFLEEKKTSAPKLYDLTSLQRDANRIFSFSAKQTLEYTQSLYEKKLVTYPRTDSRYLTEDMEDTAKAVCELYLEILFKGNAEEFTPNIKRILNSSKVTDHHAIIPTTQASNSDTLDNLPEGEKKILSLIATRLITSVARAYVYETRKVEATCNGYLFTSTEKSIKEIGFKAFDDLLRKKWNIKVDEEKTDAFILLRENDKIPVNESKVEEGFTKPAKHFTEDTLLSAMERAGADEMADDVERKGLGTPATRADIIEKLIRDGFVKREKKNLLATEEGIKLIAILPDSVKSPLLTADWENALMHVAKGELKEDEFMSGIEKMITDMVNAYEGISKEKKDTFSSESIGTCPKCGASVLYGKSGAYCKDKCGIFLSKAYSHMFTKEEAASLLKGDKTLVNGLKSKSSKRFSAYLTMTGTEDFFFTRKDGSQAEGTQLRVNMEFKTK